jgi:hypothetical protein
MPLLISAQYGLPSLYSIGYGQALLNGKILALNTGSCERDREERRHTNPQFPPGDLELAVRNSIF